MMRPARMRPAAHYQHRGGIYLAVLGAAMIVTVIGLSALTVVRVQRRAAEGATDLTEARLLAHSAIEMALLWIDNDANWRSSYSNGLWATDVPLGDGLFSVEGIDPTDANLNNDNADPLLLTGIGKQGQARFKLQVQLDSVGQPLTCLEVSLCAGNDVVFNGTNASGSQIVSANNSVIASSALVSPNVEAVNSISGQFYGGTLTPGIAPRSMPDSTSLDYYKTNGTAISFASLPSQGPTGKLESVVLGPSSNPFGVTNAEGIYVIDCLGQTLRIRNCRVLGTLVLLNPGSSTVIQDSVSFEPAVANYPSLLVEGALSFDFWSSALDEDDLDVNFNPWEDGDEDDVYPSKIVGPVYVSGDLTTSNYCTIDGVLVVGVTITSADTLDLTYRSTAFDNPPPGFGSTATMSISPGTWRQVVD